MLKTFPGHKFRSINKGVKILVEVSKHLIFFRVKISQQSEIIKVS
jgi:hypothetical protein